jgi:natural product biosynthesis luciferase-like monooxygenase protein
MSEFSEKFAALTPLQRELLARRLEQKRSQENSSATREAMPLPESQASLKKTHPPAPVGQMQFSLFFFSDDGAKATGDKYRLLLECARYADEHDFTAVWTPERHFQKFGGLYPNPSVLSAALATITSHIQIRAGSVTLPLHNPIRVAEEWSLVDNLSGGRVAVAFASGWHPLDFVLSPSAYPDRKKIMFEQIETIQRLWAGEAVKFTGGDGREVEIKIMPRPVQEKLPIWITTSGSLDTWAKAGRMGANVLAAMNKDPSQELAKQIAVYREALEEHGHEPSAGQVTIMLHTYVGTDLEKVKNKVRAPITNYLHTFMAQGGQSMDAKELGADIGKLTTDDYDSLAAFAFEKFFKTSSLLCTPDKCRSLIDHLQRVGVNEVACLVDFGLDAETIMEGLSHLNDLRAYYHSPERARAIT